MPNTYTQIHLQLVFAVKNRNALIDKKWKDNLYKYITGIIQNKNHKLLAINGMQDHLHILIGMRPNQSISELVQIIKKESTNWINENKLTSFHFYWQEGYGAFSYSLKDLNNIINYINHQEEHHKKITFHNEYIQFLKDNNISFDEAFLFKNPI